MKPHMFSTIKQIAAGKDQLYRQYDFLLTKISEQMKDLPEIQGGVQALSVTLDPLHSVKANGLSVSIEPHMQSFLIVRLSGGVVEILFQNPNGTLVQNNNKPMRPFLPSAPVFPFFFPRFARIAQVDWPIVVPDDYLMKHGLRISDNKPESTDVDSDGGIEELTDR